ncbi:MAG TPA: DNA polymerase ligase N-terminal domain-containing protein [Mycobacteriales bacterium]|jgi:bifunctional non-homologous end joining protein LigD|nr:DNA polymerase ligase N-terminal domain-containing protein [Mycobacteriales bacterium]
MSLNSYRAKRDAAKTPEPVPADHEESVDHTGDEQEGRGDRFVIQEHHATALHWDIRLQRDGVLVSWAVPKGVPLDPATNHLAKQTEDHPESYESFSGEIPKGQYGGGTMSIWDTGTYELEKWRDREVKLTLHGSRFGGRYVFFRTRGNDWMLHRMDPSPDGWSPLPDGLCPMTGRPGQLPRDDATWNYDIAWDGVRVLVAVDGGRLTVTDDGGANVTSSYPELRGLGLQLGSRQALLDGEIVAFGQDGGVDAERLRTRVGTAKPKPAQLKSTPVQLLLTDLLQLEGRSMLDEPHTGRRAALESLELGGDQWQVPDTFHGNGKAVLQAAQAQHLKGVIAKRRNSTYEPGRESDSWRTVEPKRRG